MSLVLASLFNLSCCQEKDNEKFGALEETLGILHLLPITQETAKSLSEAACIRSIALILHKGTSEARFHAVVLLQKALHLDI